MVLKSLYWILEKINAAVEDEYYNPEKIRRDLHTLSTAFENGEISEQEYQRREAEILQRLEDRDNP